MVLAASGGRQVMVDCKEREDEGWSKRGIDDEANDDEERLRL